MALAGKISGGDAAVPNPDGLEAVLWRGMMPVPSLIMQDEASVTEWFEGYVTSYLERDLRDVSAVSDLSDFKKFLKITAHYNGCIQDETAVSREAQIPQSTIHRYLNLLETTYIISRLAPFERNRKKRVVKRPKLYWFDTGLVNFLAGNRQSAGIGDKKEYGLLFEAYIYHHIRVWASLKSPSPAIYFWRLRTGEEVDFVIEDGENIMPVEVKASKKAGLGDIKNMQAFLAAYPEANIGLLAYTGKKIEKITEKIYAVPYQYFCVNE